MMKYNYDIDYIRGLLDKYYRAETSLEDEEILESFFSELNADEIPKDLASEEKMFSLMKNLHPSQEERMAPDYLMERLNSIVEKPVAAESIRKKFHNVLLYFGGSVAACILIAFTMVFIHQHKNDNPSVKMVEATHKKSETPVLIKSVETKTDLPELEHKVSEIKMSEKTHEEIEEDGFIEITDPEEAREILQNIGKLLAQNAVDTNDAMANISNSIDCYKEISKSILQ